MAETFEGFIPQSDGSGDGTRQPPRQVTSRLPAAPQTLEEIGLSPNFLQELALKVVHYSEQPMATHLARTMGLPTVHVSEILNTLRRDNLVEVVSSADYSSERDFRYRLTDKGEARAERALDRCRYAGPAPVTLTQYERIFSSTVSPDWRPSKASVRNAIESLVLDEAVIDRLTKALRSGRATMVFGSTGNGKSHILSSFIDAMEGEVLVPYSIYAHGQIIRVFDPKIHDRIPERDEEAERQPAEPGLARRQSSFEHHDRRWVRIKRPGVIVGGEIGPESLELGYDPVTRFYQAPAHFKAQGGVFVVDDFGRQKVTPAEIMNRWIMSLERGRDQLLLRTGEALDVPFHVTILFSTNLNPGDLTDSAYLRRIPYKVYIPSVRRDQFTEILRRACHQYSVHYDAENIEGAVSFIERVLNGRLYGSLSRDLIGILAENFRQEGAEPVLSAEAIRLAYQQFTGVADSLERGFRSAWAEEDAEMDAFVA